MTLIIVHQKEVERNSRQHIVAQVSPTEYEVQSWRSGNTYSVKFTDAYRDGSVRYCTATCTCDWGTWGLNSNPDGKVYGDNGQRRSSGCGHVTKVIAWLEAQNGRRISAHSTAEAARRQHRPVITPGDGMIMTSRKNGNGKPKIKSILTEGIDDIL